MNVRFVAKKDSGFMKFLGFFLSKWFMDNAWTTMRLPFGEPTIYYPSYVKDPTKLQYEPTVNHELVHVEQFQPWYGPYWMVLLYLLVPLPIYFSGRWFIERPAYLLDIRTGRRTPKGAADSLTKFYSKPWPHSWMVQWFEEHR